MMVMIIMIMMYILIHLLSLMMSDDPEDRGMGLLSAWVFVEFKNLRRDHFGDCLVFIKTFLGYIRMLW